MDVKQIIALVIAIAGVIKIILQTKIIRNQKVNAILLKSVGKAEMVANDALKSKKILSSGEKKQIALKTAGSLLIQSAIKIGMDALDSTLDNKVSEIKNS